MESRLQAVGSAGADTTTLETLNAIEKADAPPAKAGTPNLGMPKEGH